MARPKSIAPVMDRIWAKVDQSAGPDGCWPWLGCLVKGRGQIQIDGKGQYVPRIVLTEKLGRPLADRHFACHTCDNPPCVNPAHLYEGTAQTNSDDMVRRGRSPKGPRYRRHDTRRRLVDLFRTKVVAYHAAVDTSADDADWLRLDRIEADETLRAFADRLEHGGRLPEVIA